MRIARVILAVLLLTSFAHARGFMTGVGSGAGTTIFLALNCPTTGLVSVPSTNFTVTYNGGSFNGTTNNISMAAVPAGGTFTPVSPIVPVAGTTATFTFTPGATPQSYTITVTTNIAGVPVVPSSCNYNATSAVTQNPLLLVIP